MKPKTALQRQVARLSATLRPITATQEKWAYRHCFEHFAYRTNSGTMTCSDCGHVWKGEKGNLCDTVAGCKCPHCGTELKVKDTRKRTHKETAYISIITAHKGFQVIRVAQITSESRKGEVRQLYCQEVVQRWISPEGKVTDMALLRGFTFHYCDCWSYWSEMEIRPHNSLYDDVVVWSEVYPRMSLIPQLRRNGFKGNFHGISPVRLFKALLADPRMETLMKAGEIEEMKYFLSNPCICVFSSSYYLKKNTLVLSARIGDTIIETVEVSLDTFEVVQCHGKYNKDTEYHDRIINLVNSNARLIKERMTA